MKNTGEFLDKTMNRQQIRACRAVLRHIARIKNPDPMLVMGAFDAARARGWAGPDTKKALPYRALHLRHNARPRAPRSSFEILFNRRHEMLPLTRRRARELVRGAS